MTDKILTSSFQLLEMIETLEKTLIMRDMTAIRTEVNLQGALLNVVSLSVSLSEYITKLHEDIKSLVGICNENNIPLPVLHYHD